MIVLETWGFWTGLFEPLPFGDPWIATFVMLAFFAAGVKIILGGEPA